MAVSLGLFVTGKVAESTSQLLLVECSTEATCEKEKATIELQVASLEVSTLPRG